MTQNNVQICGQQICQRCKKQLAIVLSRKEYFCEDCFCKFVSLKQRKAMMLDSYYQDIFKVMYKDKIRSVEEAELLNKNSRILVPLSFGSSSLTVLDILNETLLEQKKQQFGKTGFTVHVLNCYQAPTSNKLKEDFEKAKSLIHDLENYRYYENKDNIKFYMVELDSFYNTKDLTKIVLDNKDFSTTLTDFVSNNTQYTLHDLLLECPSKSTREDFLTIIKAQLVKKFAYQHKFKAILWGNSMTKVADEIISLIVKGRGEQIASSLNNSSVDPMTENCDHSFKNLYPLKDVLLSEVDTYVHIKSLEKYLINYTNSDSLMIYDKFNGDNNITSSKPLVKNMTINDISRKYFQTIEDDYSNIISTVVRTGEKLGNPTNHSSTKSKKCTICNSIFINEPANWLTTITETEGHPIETEEEKGLYMRWQQSIDHSTETDVVDSKIDNTNKPDLLCYGCTVMLNTVNKQQIIWPKNDQDELNDILKEFVLTDDNED
ncbi:hypothetical protein TBLA_0C05540 [Henningerozyma blattae CBS 6284]|uniref:Cytoplasmic tRNA 2-thiolation protein 2 n=1 Tax=Henningerozyma blattae (strain ATCC 34711 / CBS 6284 / DSM 70876 / NBRC 10599 / NRRL Y-10934 / UCD 77-7) TaxID=1071380 RepID=I2H1V0_HENB6|nr:hypothetical protein TBLA_0C05540 [Tetrapisispora blattae CBS 6284]CCH60352.1 hypothetical protein TBLA_0C05540 [Tetrapisispora blattae CBS 6284]